MARYLVTGGLIGVGAGCAASYVYFQRQAQLSIAAEGEVGELDRHPALKYGFPTSSSLRHFAGYVVEFDTRLRNPKWVIEHLNRETIVGAGARKSSDFQEDSGIPERFRSRLSDYRGSGFDRGHMAPAANHKSSQRAMDDTFSLSNICPQVGPGFNRDYWARFERYCQTLTQRCSNVWVVTGPLYLPHRSPSGGWVLEHPMLGTPPQLMAVPTHFYKVVLGEVPPADAADGAEVVVGAWVMPNSVIEPSTPLAAFTVPLSALEEVSGLRFFPAYLNDRRRQYVDQAALAWQHAGRMQLGPAQQATPPLLLPAPPGTAPLPPPAPSGGVRHVCEHAGCRLPSEKFWLEDRGRGRRSEQPASGRGR